MIDRNNPVPLYHQLMQLLREQILNGEFSPGDQLPSESELCERYGISRITVKRALYDLTQAGLLLRMQGRGTIVRQTSEDGDLNLNSALGFSETTRRHGMTPGSEILSVETKEPHPNLKRLLNESLGASGNFTFIRRLLRVNDRPAAVVTSIVTEVVGTQMQSYPLKNRSFFRLYEQITGRRIARNDPVVHPIAASIEIAQLMGVEVGSPHFHYRSLAILEGEQPIELALGVFSGDLYEWRGSMVEVRDDRIDRMVPEFTLT